MKRICAQELDKLGLVHVRSTEYPAAASRAARSSRSRSRAIHFGVRLLLLDEPTRRCRFARRETSSA
jgi:ABC-type histidine transport system ATPase subunit